MKHILLMEFLRRHKYEVLLLALLQHLFIGIFLTDLDYQMNTIEQIFLKHADRIKTAETPMFAATQVMYEAINERIGQLVARTRYPCKYVVVIGAIFINGDREMGSFCSYQRFEYLDLATGKKTSLMKDFQESGL